MGVKTVMFSNHSMMFSCITKSESQTLLDAASKLKGVLCVKRTRSSAALSSGSAKLSAATTVNHAAHRGHILTQSTASCCVCVSLPKYPILRAACGVPIHVGSVLTIWQSFLRALAHASPARRGAVISLEFPSSSV